MKTSKKELKVRFYTTEEIAKLQTAIDSKEYKSEFKLARAYSKELNRTPYALYQKLRELVGKRDRSETKRLTKSDKVSVAKIEVIEETVKPLTLPQGMTYQGKAKKVELHADHFRVYF